MPNTQENAPRCPECDGPMLRILYGYPTFESFQAAERGEYILGGCCVTNVSPQWGCRPCQDRQAEEDQRAVFDRIRNRDRDRG
ncbi:hypothetical protein ATM97_25055 [Nocardia sp. MH4]|nr:hypothetical protein [Nocardia sp. MH4]